MRGRLSGDETRRPAKQNRTQRPARTPAENVGKRQRRNPPSGLPSNSNGELRSHHKTAYTPLLMPASHTSAGEDEEEKRYKSCSRQESAAGMQRGMPLHVCCSQNAQKRPTYRNHEVPPANASRRHHASLVRPHCYQQQRPSSRWYGHATCLACGRSSMPPCQRLAGWWCWREAVVLPPAASQAASPR